jgi:hypothetical protein
MRRPCARIVPQRRPRLGRHIAARREPALANGITSFDMDRRLVLSLVIAGQTPLHALREAQPAKELGSCDASSESICPRGCHAV